MVWKCPNCTECHDDAFELCWKCGSDSDGVLSPEFLAAFRDLTEAEWEEMRLGAAPQPPVWATICESDTNQNELDETAELEIELPERPLPRPFLHRLNGYFGRRPDTPLPNVRHQSRMAFWMAQISLVFTPPKALSKIRELLTRIHINVHKSRAGM